MATGPMKVRVDGDRIACQRFLGFGVEWDPKFWADYNRKLGVTEQDWDKVVSRIRWMRVPIVRMMMLSKWCTPRGDGQFDWGNAEMQSLFRHLDVCQREGIDVILTDWGCVVEWNRVPGFRGMGDPRYADAIGTYLDHLIRVKGYTCIRHFVLGNEPNLEGFGWSEWKAGVQNVDRVLRERGLNVVFTGSDQSNGDDWHRRAVDELSQYFKAWDLHRYASKADVANGKLAEYMRVQWGYVLSHDPDAALKARIVAEAGMSDGMIGSSLNTNVDSFEHGVFMADYAVQAVQGGSTAVLAWMLDDSSHEGFLLGMWKNKAGGFTMRPWAYPWALLVRYVPAGSTVYQVPDPAPHMRVMVARFGARWTVCVVNSGKMPAELTMSVPADCEQRVRRFLVSQASTPRDADGMPASVGEPQRLPPGAAWSVASPGQSVIFATSME